MNTKNNLHTALNKAFENHEEPLNEAQWTRLEGAIVTRKKRRWLPFFLIFMIMCITSGTTYLLTLNYGLNTHRISSNVLTQKTRFNKKSIASNNTKVDLPLAASSYNINNLSLNATIASRKHSTYKTNDYVTDIIIANNEAITPSNNELIIETLSNMPVEESIIDLPLIEDKTLETIALEKETKMDIALKNNDTNYSSKAAKEEIEDTKQRPSKIAFSITSGYSKMNVKVSSLENAEKLHKDTKKIFEESNKNLKTEYINLGVDYTILARFRIGINTGLQYLRIASPININYKLTEVPFWDHRHTQIEGYLTKDTSSAIQFNSNTTNYTTYINLPIRGNYSIPLNAKNEILITAGGSFSILASAKGQNININKELNIEPGTRTLNRDMYRKINAGLAGGIQYNTKLKDACWIGIENLWQTNPMKYKTGYGSVKNKLQGYSVNFIIKYKI